MSREPKQPVTDEGSDHSKRMSHNLRKLTMSSGNSLCCCADNRNGNIQESAK